MATIYVDGNSHVVNGADNLLQACLSLGLDIPYFCWHPALGSVGACRQCAVKQYKDADDKNGRIVMSCMTPASDNSYISIGDAEAKEFRETIVSFLMTNHPHDCPVCEEGGHCHLQDMTVMTGHHSRDYRFSKRTHRNQELGPFIGHEMNRCISCYRCVRYYNDYAGGTDLGVFGTAANVYFGRKEDGVLESEFSGNLTEICPTGVFTDKTHSERYTRKWDMQFAPSICTGCAVGCNISPGERYGEVRRIENRYNGEVNGYFLCDRGRFGYGHVNRKDRPRHVQIKREGKWLQLSKADGLEQAGAMLSGSAPLIGIGSPRASIEANFALRTLVGADNFYAGVSAQDASLTKLCLQVLRDGPVGAATIRRIEESDAVLVLGEDLMATAARIALALRQAARGKLDTLCADKKVPEWQALSAIDIAQRQLNPVFVATTAATRFDELAKLTYRASANDLAALGHAIAQAIDAGAPTASVTPAISELAQQIAVALKGARKPLIISGTGAGSEAVIQAAANIAWALAKSNADTALSLVVPEVNSLGLALMDAPALDVALARLNGDTHLVVVLENDLSRRIGHAALDAALKKSALIVVDHQQTDTANAAALVLPAASFAEGDGTVVNLEGRAQRYFQNFDPAFYDQHIGTQESWRWLSQLGVARGQKGWADLDAIMADCAATLPVLAGIVDAAPGAKFTIHGLRLARSPQRQSGRTAQRANIFVHEPRSTQDADSALNFSMEGFNGTQAGERPASMISYAWSPGWNSPSAWNKFQSEIGGALRGGDAGVHLFRHNGSTNYFPAKLVVADGLRLQPMFHHFGSDELSSLSAPIQERIPQAYVALNMGDAQRLGLEHQALALVEIDGTVLRLPAKVRLDLPAGVVGLPSGLAGIPPLTAGAAVKVSKGD